MASEVYRYIFSAHVPTEDIEAALALALVACESLHGASQLRLDAAHYFDASQKACVIAAGSDVGRDVNRLFVGFITGQFGEDAFEVERVGPREPAAVAG